MKSLSILIPTIKRHEPFLIKLMIELSRQIRPYEEDIEVLVDEDETATIGEKRNRLLQKASGKYACFFDSDDFPSPNYISWLMKAVESDCDCASLKGIMTTDGSNPEIFEHSIKYKVWRTTENEIKYERSPNHLSLIKTSISKRFQFPEKNHGEDHIWSSKLQTSGLLKTEYYIDEVIYYYNFIRKLKPEGSE